MAVHRVQSSCDELLAAGTRFERETLLTFEQGGKYAPESVAEHRWGTGCSCMSIAEA